MKILMYGWEFPPHITGGLGTACFGLSQSLSKLVTKLVFVLPRLKTDVHEGGLIEVVGVNQLRQQPLSAEAQRWTQLMERLPGFEFAPVDSPLRPYQTDEEYHRLVAAHSETLHRFMMGTTPAGATAQAEEISGDYGPNLLDEVRRYGEQAALAVFRDQFDVIHAHDWMTFLAGVRAKQMTGLPLVVHVHATEFDRSGDQIDHRVYELERLGMEKADRIIAVSRRTKDMIVERYGISADKVVVVHNGVTSRPLPPRQPSLSPHEKLVVFVGRITMQKGPEYFLEAAYLVTQKLDHVRFVMAGSGDLLPRMIDRMAQLGILDRFHFTGFVRESQRDELLSRADLFVLSSISEPFGIAPMEALQHNVPVIVTKQAGVAEVLTSAIKVDFWDVRRMADAMINILTHQELAQELTAGGNRDVAGLTWDQAAVRVRDVYREVR